MSVPLHTRIEMKSKSVLSASRSMYVEDLLAGNVGVIWFFSSVRDSNRNLVLNLLFPR